MTTRSILIAAFVLLGALLRAAEPIPVLLLSGQNNHDWQTMSPFLMALMKRPGFAPEESDSPPKGAPKEAWDAWRPQFEKYRCVVMNYNGEEWPDEVKRSFEAYVAGGGGVLVIHAGNNAFTGWKEYEKMVGLLWRGKGYGTHLFVNDDGSLGREDQGEASGHGKQWEFTLTVRDAAHPLAAGMPATWKHTADELYHNQRGPAADVHVILSAFSDPGQKGTGKHEPIVWWVPYGKGRVMTNVMGHVGATASLSCVGFQTTFLRGIEWVATGACATPIPADFPTAEKTSQWYPGGLPKIPLAEHTPEEAARMLTLPPGYHAELVAAEPTIISPVLCTWDGNGRMYVAEMRSYMLDVDAGGEDEPISRVTRLTSSKGDGVLDRSTVYADHLVLPRMVLPLDDRVVIAETYTGKFVSYRDTDNDGVADEKKNLTDGPATKNNLEHQDSGILWGVDNFIYTASAGTRRLRLVGDKLESDPLFGMGSQWGLAMDDTGRVYSSAAGGERSAYGFQQHPAYGSLQLPGELEPGFDETFPAVQSVDMQGGLERVHPQKGALNHFTGCGGQSIFRGDRLPADFSGDYILPEPVGRLVRRAKVAVVDGKRVLRNAYPQGEFITSTDVTFRPVWSATGPDGCLYIVDMHHGIIQESAWVSKGGYLRKVVERDGFGKYVGHGRIYRIVADGITPGPAPRMLDETPAQLVAHLSHPNGWWRDTAQKLLVLKGDKSVVPALATLAASGGSPLGRLHALWTLDGLGATTRERLVAAFADADERVRAGAIRIAEAAIRTGDLSLAEAIKPLLGDRSPDVVVQAINTLRYLPDKAAHELIRNAINVHLGNEVITATAQQAVQFDPKNPSNVQVNIDPVGLALMKAGREHYAEICFACHGQDGKGVVTSDGVHIAPPLAGSPRVYSQAAVTRIVLHGLTGEIDGRQYPGLMVPQKANDDKWIAEVLTYVRNSFGNSAPPIVPEDVARIRKAVGDRAPYTLAELAPLIPVMPEVMRSWTFSASNNAGAAKRTVDGDQTTRWDTASRQQQGQWFQFDMGKRMGLTHLVIDARKSNRDFPKKFEIRTSLDGQTWSEPVLTVDGKPVCEIDFPQEVQARAVRLVIVEPTDLFWSINELSVCGVDR